MAGTLYLFPCPIIEEKIETIPQYVIDNIHQVNIFVAERARTARRYLKLIKHPTTMSDIVIIEMDKHNPDIIPDAFLEIVNSGQNIGLLSEAGCPGVADPGALYVRKAYQLHMIVKPMVGPSSILMALMASGMNGQNFAFVGYLPQQTNERSKKLKQLESIVKKTNQSQIFIETPYRNKSIIENMLEILAPETYLCIAMDITGETEFIKSKPIHLWKKTKLPEVHKRPAIYIIGK